MSNITNNQPSQMETNMDHYTLIENLFAQFIESGGAPKVTEFKKHIDLLIKDRIKPLCSSQGKAGSVGGGWRSEQKSLFSGRGEKWCKVSVDSLRETISGFENDGVDLKDYNDWITKAGFAWIRYAGPRVVKGNNVAGFEVRTSGSTIDHPKQLHYINDSLVNEVEKLGGTPHSMKLEWVHNESVNDEKPSEEVIVVEEPVNDEKPSEVIEVKEEVEEKLQAPTSSDPEAWEAYLAAEGLGCDDEEDFDQLNEDMF